MLQANVDRNVLSEPMRLLFDELMVKHAKVEYCLTVSAKQDANNPDFWTLVFRDPRFSEDEVAPVGLVRWAWGKRNDREYITKSRLINSGKRQYDREERKSKRTKDMKKAVKDVIEFIKPFAWRELVAEEYGFAQRVTSKWRDENDGVTYRFRPRAEEMVEEVKYLLSMGVIFKTEVFKKMVDLLPEWDENERRKQVKAEFDSIIVRDDKVVFIANKEGADVEYPSLDQLPEKHRNAIALLDIVGEEQHLPEVGYKGKHRKYFVYA